MRIVARVILAAATLFFCWSLLLPCQSVNVRAGWSLGLEAAPIFVDVSVYEAATPAVILALLIAVAACLPLRSWPAVVILVVNLGAVTFHAVRFRFWGAFVLGHADQVLYGYGVHLWACGLVLFASVLVLGAELYRMLKAKKLQTG